MTNIQRISEPVAPRSTAWVRHEYSRRPAFNVDGTRILMFGNAG